MFCLVLETVLQICWTLQPSRLLPMDRRGSEGPRTGLPGSGPPVSWRSPPLGLPSQRLLCTLLPRGGGGVCAHQLFSSEKSTSKRRMTRKHKQKRQSDANEGYGIYFLQRGLHRNWKILLSPKPLLPQKAHKLCENHPCACVSSSWAHHATSCGNPFLLDCPGRSRVPVPAGQGHEGSHLPVMARGALGAKQYKGGGLSLEPSGLSTSDHPADWGAWAPRRR